MQIGDVVQLKSGGPLLVIIGFDQGLFHTSEKAICLWITESDFRLQREEIELAALIPRSPLVK